MPKQTPPTPRLPHHHPPARFVRSLRRFRPLHRVAGVALALFVVISGVTGGLLGWKSHAEWLQPSTASGSSPDLSTWLPLHEVEAAARGALSREPGAPDGATATIERMDARPSKGVVKVRFEPGWWEVQVDAATGSVLSVGRRHADWIEAIHDGSIIGELFKLLSMNLLALGLLGLALTGVWLWLGPRRIRRRKARHTTHP